MLFGYACVSTSRPELDNLLRLLRDGDTLKITRLDRLGRSVLHLVTLGAELRARGVSLHVIEQGIDTSTAEGRDAEQVALAQRYDAGEKTVQQDRRSLRGAAHHPSMGISPRKQGQRPAISPAPPREPAGAATDRAARR